jgi:hypothetical protein
MSTLTLKQQFAGRHAAPLGRARYPDSEPISFCSYSLVLWATHLGLHLSTHAEKGARYVEYGSFFLFQ